MKYQNKTTLKNILENASNKNLTKKKSVVWKDFFDETLTNSSVSERDLTRQELNYRTYDPKRTNKTTYVNGSSSSYKKTNQYKPVMTNQYLTSSNQNNYDFKKKTINNFSKSSVKTGANTVVESDKYSSNNGLTSSMYYRNSQNGSRSRLSQSYVNQSRVISETKGQPRLLERKDIGTRVVGHNKLKSVQKDQKVYYGQSRVVNEKVLQGTERRSEMRTFSNKKQEVEKIQKEKIVEIIKEIPVPREKYVDVQVDVIVDVPVERLIEKEKIIEKRVEVPVEKVVERHIEEIVEIPVEKIIEVPVEVEKIVKVPRERIVQKPYDVVKENIIWSENKIEVDERNLHQYPHAQVLPTKVHRKTVDRYVDRPIYHENIVHKKVPIEKKKIIEVPKQKVIKKTVEHVVERPVYVDKIINKEVQYHVEVPVYKEVQVEVEKPVYRENIIERKVPIEKIVEKEVEVLVEHVVEKPVIVENIIRKEIEQIVEVPVPVEQIEEVEVEQLVERIVMVDKVVEKFVDKIVKKRVPIKKRVEVPVEVEVEKIVKVPVEKFIEKKVKRLVEVPVEKIIERPVVINKVVERPVYREKIIEVPVERIVENVRTVEKVVEKPVFIDREVFKEVEVIKEKIIEVPVEKKVEVDVEVIVEKPVYKEVLIEQEVLVESNVASFGQENQREYTEEKEDKELAREIVNRRRMVQESKSKNKNLMDRLMRSKHELSQIKSSNYCSIKERNIELKMKLEQNLKKMRQANVSKAKLLKKSQKSTECETVLKVNPRVNQLKQKLKGLITSNNQLISQISSKGQNLRMSLKRS